MKTQIASTLLAVSLILVSCTKKDNQQNNHLEDLNNRNTPSIINGEVVEANEALFATTVRLFYFYQDAWTPVCTGTIVADDLVLTAAHCVMYGEAKEFRWGFGAQPVTFEGQKDPATRVDVVAKFKTIPVSEMVIHEKYGDSRYDHDFALTKLAGVIPVGFKKSTLLPDLLATQIEDGKTYAVILAGYGLTKEKPSVETEVLRKTTVNAFFEGSHVVTDQTQGSGGCNGDSGGPMFLTVGGNLYLVGVTHGPYGSFGDCYHQGSWGNPVKSRAWMNESAKALGSSAQF